MDYDLTRAVLAALEREGVKYVVFGAVALALHGLPRATEDLDIFIAPERDNVERLKVALRSVFDDPCIDEISADDLLGEYPAVQYVPPTGNFHIDLLTRLGERFDFASLASEKVDFDGVSVSTVTPETLYRISYEEGYDSPEGLGRRTADRPPLRFERLTMPVRKFRDVSEMEDTLWYERNDPALPRAIASVWDFAARVCPLQFPRGVHKYRSIEDANADRERWEEANFRAFQDRRRAKTSRL